MGVRVAEEREGEALFWKEIGLDSDKEASMQVHRDEMKRQELGEKAHKRTLLPEEVLSAKRL